MNYMNLKLNLDGEINFQNSKQIVFDDSIIMWNIIIFNKINKK